MDGLILLAGNCISLIIHTEISRYTFQALVILVVDAYTTVVKQNVL